MTEIIKELPLIFRPKMTYPTPWSVCDS